MYMAISKIIVSTYTANIHCLQSYRNTIYIILNVCTCTVHNTIIPLVVLSLYTGNSGFINNSIPLNMPIGDDSASEGCIVFLVGVASSTL